MFSEAPIGQIKKVMSFALWADIYWYGLALFLQAVLWIDVLFSLAHVQAIKM